MRTIIIGVTGGVGMGKSVVAGQLARLGAKICSADAIAHRLMRKGGAAVEKIHAEFPGVVKAGEVDRKALGEIVFNDSKKRKILERILHPLIASEEKRFAARAARKGAKIVAFDIPLLFETGAESRCDITVAATAPAFIQRQRVMKRANMTEGKFNSIVAAQMPDREKRSRADIVVATGLGKAYSFRQIAELMRKLHAA